MENNFLGVIYTFNRWTASKDIKREIRRECEQKFTPLNDTISALKTKVEEAMEREVR